MIPDRELCNTVLKMLPSINKSFFIIFMYTLVVNSSYIAFQMKPGSWMSNQVSRISSESFYRLRLSFWKSVSLFF